MSLFTYWESIHTAICVSTMKKSIFWYAKELFFAYKMTLFFVIITYRLDYKARRERYKKLNLRYTYFKYVSCAILSIFSMQASFQKLSPMFNKFLLFDKHSLCTKLA